ncbi:calcium-binding protein 8 isoform X2 [Dunckerocampus dactyliophorus]|uniref:calcium-binding protein 8 isoform X2 n=1 Tax=Dunckerocampus dactyliophorus TaxID=161453 RepID=UPI0024061BB9|nr:calcium-binding protein 8 isoform X2 [Dunckerocampus dactyliophorus]
MASSPSRSWEWPCARWVTCPVRWSWPSSCRGWTWMDGSDKHLPARTCPPLLQDEASTASASRDGQVDFEEFMTILGPKLLSSDNREGFLGNTIDNIFWQFDMQQLSLDELKQVLFHAFRDHLTMKDIENIIITEEESLNETSGNCPEYEGVHPKKKNRQTCVRKSLICAFAIAFIISVMLIAANQMLRNGME